jgi:hypothetical protein
MPYNAGPPLPLEDDEQPWRPGGNVSGGQLTGAVPGVSGAASGGSVGSTGGAGRFVNFGRMFDLNKEKAASTANRAVSGLDDSARRAQGQLDRASADFAGNAATAGTQFDPMRGQGGQTTGSAPGSTSGTRRDSSEQETTTRNNAATTRGGGAITFDETQARQAAETLNAAGRPWTPEELAAGRAQTYTGPAELDTSGMERAFGSVQDRARALGQPGGIESEVARSMGGSPTQSTGNSRWEAGLAGVAGAEGLQAASNRYKDFAGRLASARETSAGQAAAARDRVAGQAAQFEGYSPATQPVFGNVDTETTVTRSQGLPPWGGQLESSGIPKSQFPAFARSLMESDMEAYTALVNDRLTDAQVRALVERQRRPPRGG